MKKRTIYELQKTKQKTSKKDSSSLNYYSKFGLWDKFMKEAIVLK